MQYKMLNDVTCILPLCVYYTRHISVLVQKYRTVPYVYLCTLLDIYLIPVQYTFTTSSSGDDLC